MPNESKSPTSFLRVAECLYRNESSGGYYALVKKSGKQIRRSLKTTDRKLAERRLRDFREQLTGLDLSKDQASICFEQLAEHWFDSIKHGLKPKSALRRATCIGQLERYFKGLGVRQITRLRCDEWAQKRSPKIAASTFNQERETLISILDYGLREGVILENPALVVKRRKIGKQTILIPSKEQFKILIRTLRGLDVRYQRAASLVELLAYSGLRKGEANALTWKDIDFERGSFIVTGGESGTKNHEVRVVPLFPALADYLKQ